MPRIMPNDSIRFITKFFSPPFFGSGCTSQASLSASCSAAITPVAPKMIPPTLSTHFIQLLACGFEAFEIIDSTSSPAGPVTSLICCAIFARAAFCPPSPVAS